MFNRFIWKYFVRRLAHAHGFLDPVRLFTKISRFAQPSEVLAPTELLRATAVLHARGLLNTQVIQHNLDWIWPFWVNKQFDPKDDSFIPRSFSLTHINLTHRNWTAVGLPDMEETPLVDPRGLVTPFWDSWSIDVWIVAKNGKDLIPAQLNEVDQYLELEDNSVVTKSSSGDMHLTTRVKMIKEEGNPTCCIAMTAEGQNSNCLVVSLRPYNPEGISLVKDISLLKRGPGWRVNKMHDVLFDIEPEHYVVSDFHHGDVYYQFNEKSSAKEHISCSHEMASAAAVFNLEKGKKREVKVSIPLREKTRLSKKSSDAGKNWIEYLEKSCQLEVPDKHFQYLFNSSLRTVITHTAEDVYAGPYIYKRFWFRDAVFITYSLLCCGFYERAERIIDRFHERQGISGYFESQEGEWDSNGQVLWLIQKFVQMTNKPPKDEWKEMIHKGARWIKRKRLADNMKKIHAGLMPSGFSAEHFGPNDYYYWDDFWSIGGLEAASYLAFMYGEEKESAVFSREADLLRQAVDKSLQDVESRIKRQAIPSSPYRRLDSSAVGSLACGYPLQLNIQENVRLSDTAEYLFDHCLVNNGFFHDMSHSGINPYLTLHMAQVFLRAGDKRYFQLMKGIADLASPTGQWPEAIHPKTKGGCMGDGQHTWAAAEWMIMMRNCFVREEEAVGKLILCSGVPLEWLKKENNILFGPASTIYGEISLEIKCHQKDILIQWKANWHKEPPQMEIKIPGMSTVSVNGDEQEISFNLT